METLECLPDPVLLIDGDYAVSWSNARAREIYGETLSSCHEMSHGLREPCDRTGEDCPKALAEVSGEPAHAIHAHAGTHDELVLHRVFAIPVEGGGVLEVHTDLGHGTPRDGLTGCYNEAHWRPIIESEHALLSLFERESGTMLIELDNHSGIVTSSGKHAAQHALSLLGAAIPATVGATATVGRINETTFAAYLPAASPPELAACGRAAVEVVRQLSVPTMEGPLTISVSIGCCSVGPRETLAHALMMAERALQTARSTGGDTSLLES